MDLTKRMALLREKDPVKFAAIDAVQAQDNLALALLLPQLRDIDVVDPGGYTLLMLALWAKNDIAVDMLIERGANVNKECQHMDSLTPLGIASSLNHVEYTKILLKAGANPNYENAMGQRILHIACENDAYDVYDVLVEGGADESVVQGQNWDDYVKAIERHRIG